MNMMRDLAFARRSLPSRAISASVAGTYDQTPWSLLYKAILDSVGAKPDQFQLLYPFASWNWETQDVGFIGAAQYDFCSVVPQWSAVGEYVSSGDRFNQAYAQFLDVIVPATQDPVLRGKISDLQQALTKATNDYTTAYTQAQSVYNDAVKSGTPTFTEWLGTPPGKGWQTQIVSTGKTVDQAQANYVAMVAEANTPGLDDAQKQLANTDFYSKLKNPGLSGFPKVPSWTVSQDPAAWVDAIKANRGPAGVTMGFNNRDSSYDFSKTWASGSLSINEFFWSVNVNGSWERVSEFETDQELNVSVEFEAFDLIQIQPGDWYNGSFVRSMSNGPFSYGYTAFGENGTKAVFGETGFIGLLKTGMYVGYKPTFTITTSQSTFQSFLEKFKACGGLRIGPFTIDAEGGSEKSNWSYNEQGRTFSGTSTSDTPLIVGVTVSQLPSQRPTPNLLADSAEAPPRGVAYRFEACAGDVVARDVTEAEATAMGARSWKAATALALVTRHAHDVRIVPMYGDPVLSDGIGSVDFVGVNLTQFRAGVFAQGKPIPAVGTQYTISGEWDDTNLPFVYHLGCTAAARPMSRFA